MSDEIKKTVYSRDSVEFVTVAVQYCAFIENLEDILSEELTDKLTKLLPLLYLKASLIPETELLEDENLEITVSEADYAYISSKLYDIFGENDAYLEVFMQDMKYSDTPIGASISEDLADIYQDLKNYITIYERGLTENMNDAMYVCTENFKAYWGQKLVNVLRALHSIKYSAVSSNDMYDDSEFENTEDIW